MSILKACSSSKHCIFLCRLTQKISLENLIFVSRSWYKPSNARVEYWAQNGLRTFLVLLTIGIALKCPYSASMLGAVGGLTDALQSFVLPPLIFLNVSGLNLSTTQKGYNLLIILWGSVTILYTIVYNIATFIL